MIAVILNLVILFALLMKFIWCHQQPEIVGVVMWIMITVAATCEDNERRNNDH